MTLRRMITKSIIRSAHFMKLPTNSQFLYIQMIMEADDDGFVSNPDLVVSFSHCTDEDLKALVDQHYVYLFDSGIALIRHWFLHNYIRRDRYRETDYPEKNLVTVTENKVYEFINDDDNNESSNGYNLLD
jgi:hypothetical protein